MTERDRPSAHGVLMGHALAQLAEAGRRSTATELPDPCLTCAFRPGCMTNQMASAGLVAFNCTLGIDPADFMCHHGMKSGQPTKLCVGWLAAKLAPFSFKKEVVAALHARMADLPDVDSIRAEFDSWVAEVDPERKMDDYRLARAYATKA